jgi:hypothetical protein
MGLTASFVGILIWHDLEQCHMEDLDLGLIVSCNTCLD